MLLIADAPSHQPRPTEIDDLKLDLIFNQKSGPKPHMSRGRLRATAKYCWARATASIAPLVGDRMRGKDRRGFRAA